MEQNSAIKSCYFSRGNFCCNPLDGAVTKSLCLSVSILTDQHVCYKRISGQSFFDVLFYVLVAGDGDLVFVRVVYYVYSFLFSCFIVFSF